MFFTMSIFLLIAAIILVFSQEFIGFFKRITDIRGGMVLVPLFIASFLVVFIEEDWPVAVEYYLQDVRNFLLYIQSHLTGTSYAAALAAIIFLTLSAMLPVIVLEIVMRKKNYKHYPYPYETSTFLWLINVLLLLIIYV